MLEKGQRLADFVVEEFLGRGGMAQVYRVRHARLGSRHALKVLVGETEELRRRFLNEGRIQAQLSHPAIVPVTGIVESRGLVGLVMEYVEGESLEGLFGPGALLPKATVRLIGLQLLSALSYVHERGVVHRDLKPSNVMVDRHEGRLRARLLDFGVAKFEPEGPALTRTGTTLGTLQYMSPEQVKGERVDPRSDLFSLGVMLHELLSGRLPFEAESAFKLQMAIVEGRRTSQPLPEPLARLFDRALALDPADRFQSAEEFARALGEAIEGESSEWLPAPEGERFRGRQSEDEAEPEDLKEALGRKSLARPLLLALLGAALVAGVWLLRERRPSGLDTRSLEELVRASTRVEPRTGLELVRLPGGEFLMGCEKEDPDCARDEPPPRLVRVKGFWLSRTETPVKAWEACVSAGACASKARSVVNSEGERCNPGHPERRLHPVNCLTFEEARAFCAFAGGRLPSAAEWEFAAKSGGSALYPWGGEPPTVAHARFAESPGKKGSAETGSHPAGESPWGLLDLAGNVWEVTGDLFDSQKGTVEARGGSFKSKPQWLRASNRFEVDPLTRSDSLGVRCAFDA